jgi:hypothetical protein
MVNCLNCGKLIIDKWTQSHPKRDRKFCSTKCFLTSYKLWEKTSQKDSRIFFTCNYCGKKFKNWLSNKKNYKKTYCSHKCQWLSYKQNIGEKSNNWKGGITPKINQRCNSNWWIELRRSVYKRDNYACQMCGKTYCRLECHHILPERLKGKHEESNLISLCQSCHKFAEWKVRNSEVFKRNFVDRENNW